MTSYAAAAQAAQDAQTRNEENERELVCTGCGTRIVVCCYVDHFNPDTFRGAICGCRKLKEKGSE